METTPSRGGLSVSSFFSFLRRETNDPSARKIERWLLFIVAVLLGFAVKTLLSPVLTIGYEDYTITPSDNEKSIEEIEKNLFLKGESPLSGSGAPDTTQCSQ